MAVQGIGVLLGKGGTTTSADVEEGQIGGIDLLGEGLITFTTFRKRRPQPWGDQSEAAGYFPPYPEHEFAIGEFASGERNRLELTETASVEILVRGISVDRKLLLRLVESFWNSRRDPVLAERIEITESILHGTPVIKGTRISVSNIISELSERLSKKDVLEAYPSLTEDDIRYALRFASRFCDL